MPRTHGYSKIGKRCVGTHDWNAKGRTNVIGAIIGKMFLTVSLFDCNINSDIFYIWTKKDLIPKLPDKSVIVLDNAAFHKRIDIKTEIHKAGHVIEYLPPYSPELNPIEKKWAQAKNSRKKFNISVNDLFAKKTKQFQFVHI